MSVCDVCPRPGRCCTGFELRTDSLGDRAETALEALVWVASRQPTTRPGEIDWGLPFLPLYRTSGRWLFWCPNLTIDGRCGDYEHRPKLCSDYQPGSDSLCAMRTNAILREIAQPRLPSPSE